MSKRSADHQLTKDEAEAAEAAGGAGGEGEEMEEQGGTWRAASQQALAGRTIIKARRKGISAPTGVAMPAFNFGATMPAANAFAGLAAAQPPAAAAASPAAAATAPAAAASTETAAPLNALQRLAAAQKSSTWTCPTCETPNKLADRICGACDEPNPNPASAPAAPAAAAATAAAPPMNALQALQAKIAASSWECSVCMTANKMADSACASCQEPRPAGTGAASATTAAAPAAAPVTFSFGSAAPAASSSSAAAAAGTGLSFGSAPVTFGGAVTFGAAAPTFGAAAPAAAGAAAAPAPFSFGGAAEAPASSEGTFGRVPSFSFGGAALGGATPASFGSVASAPASFGSAAASSSSSAAATPAAPQFEASSAEALASAGSEVSREFRNATKESTGEEHDEVHLRVQTKVYQIKKVPVIKPAPEPTGELAAAAAGGAAAAETPLVGGTPVLDADGQVKTEQKYVEIGAGELHINTFADPASGRTRARMVLREAATKRSVLNAPVFSGMVYSVQGERMVRFNSMDLEGKMAIFMLKFKDKSAPADVVSSIDTCLEMIKQDA